MFVDDAKFFDGNNIKMADCATMTSWQVDFPDNFITHFFEKTFPAYGIENIVVEHVERIFHLADPPTLEAVAM